MKNKLKKTVQMLLCIVFSMCLLCGCGDESNESDKSTVDSIDENSTVEEIREYLADKTWYTEMDDGSGGDGLFNYSYNSYTFYSNGTAERKSYKNDGDEKGRISESAEWILTDDKTLEFHNSDGEVVEYVWGLSPVAI